MKWEGWNKTSSLLKSTMFDGYSSYPPPPHLRIVITVIVLCKACMLLGFPINLWLSIATRALVTFRERRNTFVDWFIFPSQWRNGMLRRIARQTLASHLLVCYIFTSFNSDFPFLFHTSASALCCRWRCVRGARWHLILSWSSTTVCSVVTNY